MAVFEHRFTVEAPLEAVAEFHRDSSALRVLTPPGTFLRLHGFGPMEDGMIAEFTLWLGPLPVRWRARHEDVGPRGFVDVQERGPMASWRHRHRFEPLGPNTTEVVDRVEYTHPEGLRGLGTRLLFSRFALRALFFWRARATRREARARSRGAG